MKTGSIPPETRPAKIEPVPEGGTVVWTLFLIHPISSICFLIYGFIFIVFQYSLLKYFYLSNERNDPLIIPSLADDNNEVYSIFLNILSIN